MKAPHSAGNDIRGSKIELPLYQKGEHKVLPYKQIGQTQGTVPTNKNGSALL